MKFKRRINNTGAQVAIEFVLMFSIVAFIVFYIWKLSISIASLQVREYASFMVGRAITASAESYKKKIDNAKNVMQTYNSSESFGIGSAMGVSNNIDCNFNAEDRGNRGLFHDAGTSIDWNVVSDAGTVCATTLKGVTAGASIDVVTEALTGSEISDEHCNCAMDFNKTWKECAKNAGSKKYVDNGC